MSDLSCISGNEEEIQNHGHRTVLVIYLLVWNIHVSGRVNSLNAWPEYQATRLVESVLSISTASVQTSVHPSVNSLSVYRGYLIFSV